MRPPSKTGASDRAARVTLPPLGRRPLRSLRQARGPAQQRAFTLIELMVVVILIGILTVMAIPTMAEARYSAHTLDDATRIAELYREGRTRAMGRGSATLVMASTNNTMNMTAPVGLGLYVLYEAQQGGLPNVGQVALPLPVGSPLSSCGSVLTNWATIMANPNALIDQANLNTGLEVSAQIWSTFTDATNVQRTSGALCYTPLGRTYFQPSATPVFTPGVDLLHGELQISVQRSGLGGTKTGLTRTVIVPDSGATRIVSQ